MKPKTRKLVKRIVIDTLMYSILVICLFPIVWMVITSLKSNYDVILGKISFSKHSNGINKFYSYNNKTIFVSKDGYIGAYSKNKFNKIKDFKKKVVSSQRIGENELICFSPVKNYLIDLENPRKIKPVSKMAHIPWKIARKVNSLVSAKIGDNYYVGKILVKTEIEEDRKYENQEKFEGIMKFDNSFNYLETINSTLLKNSNVSTLLADRNLLWSGSKEELLLIDPLNKKMVARWPKLKEIQIIKHFNNIEVLVISDNHVYLINKLNYKSTLVFKNKISQIQCVLIRQNNIFLGTVNGLYNYNLSSKKLSKHFVDQPKFWNVVGIHIEQNNLFLGLDDGQVKIIAKKDFSVKAESQIRNGAFDIRWENYIDMWENIDFGTYLKNSIIICFVTVLIALFMATTAGYALSRFRFPGASFFSSSILAVNMIPPLLILIPIYLMYIKFDEVTGIKLVGTYPGIIALYATWFIPMSIWILRSFFVAIPKEIEEAARIDGCNRFQVFWKIALPLAMPGIIATGIYIFLIAWDELIFATILLPQKEMLTIPLGIKLYIGNHQNRFDLMMAAATVATLPVLVLFFLVQRWFIKGLTAGAVKG
ncbi:ABC transporter permease subunit [Candidatus Margulisiibacteriota bacterium]